MKMSRRTVLDVALIVLVGMAVSALLQGRTREGTSAQPLGPMPTWSLRAADGRTLSSDDYRGKVLVLNFWASWCPPCRAEMPGFMALQDELSDQGLAVLGFSLDEEAQDHLDFVRSSGLNYPSMQLSGPEGAALVASFEGVAGSLSSIPTTLVVDRAGSVVYAHTGFLSQAELERVVRPVLAR